MKTVSRDVSVELLLNQSFCDTVKASTNNLELFLEEKIGNWNRWNMRFPAFNYVRRHYRKSLQEVLRKHVASANVRVTERVG